MASALRRPQQLTRSSRQLLEAASLSRTLARRPASIPRPLFAYARTRQYATQPEKDGEKPSASAPGTEHLYNVRLSPDGEKVAFIRSFTPDAPMDPRDEQGNKLPLPQMGWNALNAERPDHPLLAGLVPGAHAYFVHSYALSGGLPGQLLATALYGSPVAAIVGRDNLAGTQFHVEKSSLVGLRILANFLQWSP